MKHCIFALLVGVLFTIAAPLARAGCHEGCADIGPVSNARAAVVAEAQRLGLSGSDAIVTSLASLDLIRSKYSFDLGYVYECQTPVPNALEIMTDRVLAFGALNAMGDVLRDAGSNLQPFVPANGASHVETIKAVQITWPQLKNLSPDLMAAAGVANQMASLQALEAQNGTLNFEWGTADHWAISHPAAQSIIAVELAIKAHEKQSTTNALYGVCAFLLLVAALIEWSKRRRHGGNNLPDEPAAQAA